MTATIPTQVSIAGALTAVAPEGLPFRFTAYDGSATGPEDSPIHLHLEVPGSGACSSR